MTSDYLVLILVMVLSIPAYCALVVAVLLVMSYRKDRKDREEKSIPESPIVWYNTTTTTTTNPIGQSAPTPAFVPSIPEGCVECWCERKEILPEDQVEIIRVEMTDGANKAIYQCPRCKKEKSVYDIFNVTQK